MTNYHNMTDLELNRAVARLMGGYLGDTGEWLKDGVNESSGSSGYHERSYCASPSDAWLLVEKSWLTLNAIAKFDDGIGFGERDMTIWQVHTHMAGGNKLRAAVIVFLLESAK